MTTVKSRLFRNLTAAALVGVSLYALSVFPAAAQQALSVSDQPTSAAPAANNSGAAGFVDSMARKAVAFLSDRSISETQKRSEFRTLLFADFDMDTIGRFSLGSYWNSATPTQRRDYLNLFREMIASVYSQRFESYNGQRFEIRGSRADGNDTLVSSVIIPNGNPEVSVDWRVRNKGGHYKIVDVIVEGVSMAVTQRSDFSSVIQQGGGNIDVLINHLRQPTENDAPMPH